MSSKEEVPQVFVSGLLKDQVVLVTGGGTGIGRAVAFEMGRLGAKIALCGRRLEPLQKTAQDLKDAGIPEVHYGTCDIRDYEAVEKLVKDVLQRYSRIDVLINNAGGQFPILAENLNSKGFNAVIRNNLVGTWNMTIACAKNAFIPQKSGKIVNVIAQIIRGFPGMVHTGAARAGVDNLTKTLAVEWAKYNINVNSVAPGVIISSGTDRYGTPFIDKAREVTPLKRTGTVEEVSHLVTYLSSSISSFVTGQTYYIDGGQSLAGDLLPFFESGTKSNL